MFFWKRKENFDLFTYFLFWTEKIPLFSKMEIEMIHIHKKDYFTSKSLLSRKKKQDWKKSYSKIIENNKSIKFWVFPFPYSSFYLFFAQFFKKKKLTTNPFHFSFLSFLDYQNQLICWFKNFWLIMKVWRMKSFLDERIF